MTTQTIQSRVIAAVVALLSTAGQTITPHARAWRCRVESFPPDQLPAYNVLPDEGEVDIENSYSNATAEKFRFCVRCMVSATMQVDAAADPLYAAARPAILTDPTLGGLVNFTRYISQKWEKDGPAATDNLALVLTFETEFATSRTDPTVLAA